MQLRRKNKLEKKLIHAVADPPKHGSSFSLDTKGAAQISLVGEKPSLDSEQKPENSVPQRPQRRHLHVQWMRLVAAPLNTRSCCAPASPRATIKRYRKFDTKSTIESRDEWFSRKIIFCKPLQAIPLYVKFKFRRFVPEFRVSSRHCVDRAYLHPTITSMFQQLTIDCDVETTHLSAKKNPLKLSQILS